MTYEAYKDAFSPHIEGTANNDREAHESQGEDDDGKKSAVNTKSKKSMNRTNSQIGGEGDSIEQRNDGLSKRSSKRSQMD